MRRALGLFLTIILLCSSAFAAEADYSSKTVEELQAIIDAARNELLKKTVQGEGKLFIVDDTKGISMYLTGKSEKNWMDYFELEVVVINNSGKPQSISFDNISVNGWEVNTMMSGISDIGAGKKKKGSISVDPKEADISSVDEITDIELIFHTFDDDYNTTFRYGPIGVYYDGTNWSVK